MASATEECPSSSDQHDGGGQPTDAASGGEKKGKSGRRALVHPRAVLTGTVELSDGCCIGAATIIDGGQGGIFFGKNTVVEDRVKITNSGPTPMTIGRYTWIEDEAVLQNVQKIGDFVRVEAGAKVVDCEELGNGCNVAAGAKVEKRGSVGAQTVFFGHAGVMVHDPSCMVRQAASAVAHLPTHRRLLDSHV
ncbi:hypothetical protein BESB_038800 [Besnoitia besnoiti]|uniref:Dynactin subunit 6 n=1 Tax=Besnoitia besnoiti TaxID=94643 RepID=A0A2A9MNX0_BESBE|nr:hypothetical protein BESB_038800 [Besnoitia besnoiti]PFH37422.1 hypothetical protein BESB_038800 [Besnoitia besnoiti]